MLVLNLVLYLFMYMFFRRKGIYLIGCRYDVVLRVAMEFHFKIVNENEPWAMCWSDLPLLPDKIAELKRKQVFKIG